MRQPTPILRLFSRRGRRAVAPMVEESPEEQAAPADTPPARPPASRDWLHWLTLATSALLLAAVLWQVPRIVERARAATFPFALDHEEDYLLVHSWRMARGISYVQPLLGRDPPRVSESEGWRAPDFIVGTYMPLVPWAVSWLIDPRSPSLAPGRALAIAGAVAVAILVGQLLGRAGLNPVMAAALGLLFLLHRDTLKWLPLYRVDFPAMALALGGLLAMTFAAKRPNGSRAFVGWVVAATVAFLAAGFAKQTMVAAPAAALVWLGWRRGAGWAALWAAASLATGLVVYGVVASGQAGSFWFHTFTANANTMSGEQLRVWAVHYLRFNSWLVVAAVAAPAAGALLRILVNNVRNDQPPKRPSCGTTFLLLVYALLGVATFLGSAKLGAAENYMLEPTVGLLLLTGCGLAALEGGTGAMASRGAAWTAGFALLAVHFVWLFRPEPLRHDGHAVVLLGVSSPTVEDQAAALAVDSLVERDPEGTWCERAAFSLRHGAPLFLHPFICAQLAREGKWDESPAIAEIASGRFRRLIVTEDIGPEAFQSGDAQYTPAMREAIRAHYRLAAVHPGLHFTYYVWERTPND